MITHPNYAKKSRPGSLTTIELENKKFFVTYKSMKSLKIFDKTLSITSFNNVNFSSAKNNLINNEEARPSRIIKGPCFVISSRMLYDQYFHLMYDILMEIEIIKKFYPTLKIIFLNESKGHDHKRMTSIFKNLKITEAYNITKDNMISLKDFSVMTIEQLLFIFPLKDSIPSYLLKADTFDFSYPKTKNWGSLMKESLSSRFLSNNSGSGRKIFISRINENDKKRTRSEIIQKLVFGYSISKENYDYDDLEMAWNLPSTEYRSWVDRPMIKREEVLLEKMFKDAGYEIVNPSEYKDVYEQAKLFNSAKYIVGLSGAGFVNCCFCNKDAKVLILNSCDYYTFPHENIVASFDLDVAVSPKRRPWRDSTYKATGIFESVKKYHPEFLML
jgi:hypothetical protein